ncbi:unnamed protein product [Rhodiola kirilowii]
MAGTASRGFGIWGSTLDRSSSQRCQYGELVAECRSSEQLDNETPSTSDDDESGLKPSDLYGKFTWKIDKFSQINKRELRSSTFEIGGYKWYILIYPQGCDVCHHLSLFLCVADHDKLLPGWCHSALFTISVISKDPKKSKYSDTLHQFWKKEHDWGWKKFMELPKVLDEFLDNDTLIVKAQVQVIREKANGPFRCLDLQYKRELARVYLAQVEQIFRRFVEERREKLVKLIENKARWSSFCSFWQQIDLSTRKWMSSENRDIILGRILKQFFVGNEVTSILVLDSLYFGMKALQGHYSYANEAPIARVEKEVFVLADDVVPIIERVVLKPLLPKDEKGPQQLRTKDVSPEDDSCKNTNEQSERRLAELGRKSLEIYILDHIFSNRVEIAYQEAVSLQMQEDLIREEAEYEKVRQRSSGKENKSKKKQAKHKRSNKKEKEKIKDKRRVRVIDPDADIIDDTEDCATEVALPTPEQLDAEDVSANGTDGKRSSIIDDSSSTCSTDSISSVLLNSSAISSPQFETKSVFRKKIQQHNGTNADNRLTVSKVCQPMAAKRLQYDVSVSSKVAAKEEYELAPSYQNERELSKQHLAIKDVLLPKNEITIEKSTAAPSCSVSPPKRATASGPEKQLLSETNADRKLNAKTDTTSHSEVPIIQPQAQQHAVSQKGTEKSMNLQRPLLSKPFSAHGVPGSRRAAQSLSSTKSTLLSDNSSSIAGQTGPNRLPSSVRNVAPQSYKSAVLQNAEGSSLSNPISLRGAIKDEYQWTNISQSRNMGLEPPSLASDLQQLSLGSYQHSSSLENLSTKLPATSTDNQTQADEFPHLDLINYLLDDEQNTRNVASSGAAPHDPISDNLRHIVNRQLSFPGEFAALSSSSFRPEDQTPINQDNGLQGSYNFYDTQFSSWNNMMPQTDRLNSDQLQLLSPRMFSTQMQQDTSYHLPPVYPNSSNINGTFHAFRLGN